MKQIRRNVWETNSSSCHSISLSNDNSFEECNIPMDDEGYLLIPMIGFCSTETYSSQEEKLAYAVQVAATKNGIHLNYWSSTQATQMEQSLNELYNCDDFQNIEDKVRAYVGSSCKGIRFEPESREGYIDDSSDYYNFKEFEDDCGGIIRFVFGSASVLRYYYNG